MVLGERSRIFGEWTIGYRRISFVMIKLQMVSVISWYWVIISVLFCHIIASGKKSNKWRMITINIGKVYA